MDPANITYEYALQNVSWLQRDALLFANSIGAYADEPQFLRVPCTIASLTYPTLGITPRLCRFPHIPSYTSYGL